MNYWKIKNQLGDGSVLGDPSADQDRQTASPGGTGKLEQVGLSTSTSARCSVVRRISWDRSRSRSIPRKTLKFGLFLQMDVVYETAEGSHLCPHLPSASSTTSKMRWRGMRFNGAPVGVRSDPPTMASRPFLLGDQRGAQRSRGAAAPDRDLEPLPARLLKHEMTPRRSGGPFAASWWS